jgi:hypothetical protein
MDPEQRGHNCAAPAVARSRTFDMVHHPRAMLSKQLQPTTAAQHSLQLQTMCNAAAAFWHRRWRVPRIELTRVLTAQGQCSLAQPLTDNHCF